MEKLIKYFIGHSCNADNRYMAASGGIATSVIKYLLENKKAGTALSFKFNADKCIYEPILIDKFLDYNICGSIYQEIDLYSFFKENIKKLGSLVVVTCLPCQIKPLKNLFAKHNIRYFIISLVCSGQVEMEGSFCYYKFLHLNKKDIIGVRYRGNGWPSGIQIRLKDGTEIFKRNWSYPWSLIHSSRLFQPKRCFYCKHVVNYESDLTLADPWLDEYIKNDNIGHTLFSVNTRVGNEVIRQMIVEKKICVRRTNIDDFIISQSPTYKRRVDNPPSKNKIRKVVSICRNNTYKAFMSRSPYLMKLHNRIVIKILK